MMIYKRAESFRFSFDPNLDCSFRIVRIGTNCIESNMSKGKIIDISSKGMKISSLLDIPIKNEVAIRLSFTITGNAFIEAEGLLVWQRFIKDSLYHYGIRFINTNDIGDLIISEIKQYAKEIRRNE